MGFLIVAAAVSLVLGVVLPILRLTHLYVWTNTHSLASVVVALAQDDEFFLAAILVIFSIIFPALKIAYLIALYVLPSKPDKERVELLKRLSWLGKWSMLDVLVLALMIFYVKTSGIASAASLPGIYFFTASVVMTMVATHLSHRDGISPDL